MRYAICKFFLNAKEDGLEFDLVEGEQVVSVEFVTYHEDSGERYRVVTVRPVRDKHRGES